MADNDSLNLQDGLASFQWENGHETYANYDFEVAGLTPIYIPTPTATGLVNHSTLLYTSDINADPGLDDVADNNVGIVGMPSTNGDPGQTTNVPNLPSGSTLWETYKDDMRHHYLVLDKPLKSVQEYMKTTYNFQAR
jgi:hypothetical protein